MKKENIAKILYGKSYDPAIHRYVAKKTGWSALKTAHKMKEAYMLGMLPEEYKKKEAWKKTKKEIKELMQREKENAIQTAQEHIYWSYKEVEKDMDEAYKMGISYVVYAKNFIFDLTREERAEFLDCKIKLKKENTKDFEFFREIVMERSGWSKEKATREMKNAKKQGISALKYTVTESYLHTEKTLKKRGNFYKNDKKRIHTNRLNYIKKTQEVTGWKRGKVELEMLKAKVNCGASYEDYFVFEFYKLSPEEQDNYITYRKFNKMKIKYNSKRIGAKYFEDKKTFNETFAEFIHRVWFINDEMPYEEFLEKIQGLEKVIVKPLYAQQGKGIKVFECNESEEQNKALYEYIMGQKESIVEEFIVQHKEMQAFSEKSVNTIRIATLNDHGTCRFLYAVVRMGRGEVIDNFHAGGVAAAVNVETGLVYTNAADLDCNFYEKSPATGKVLKGSQIPHWDQIRDVCQKACTKVEGVNIVGWDFAITEKGAELVEGNSGASYVLAQVPNVQEKIGLSAQMADPYL